MIGMICASFQTSTMADKAKAKAKEQNKVKLVLFNQQIANERVRGLAPRVDYM